MTSRLGLTWEGEADRRWACLCANAPRDLAVKAWRPHTRGPPARMWDAVSGPWESGPPREGVCPWKRSVCHAE